MANKTMAGDDWARALVSSSPLRTVWLLVSVCAVLPKRQQQKVVARVGIRAYPLAWRMARNEVTDGGMAHICLGICMRYFCKMPQYTVITYLRTIHFKYTYVYARCMRKINKRTHLLMPTSPHGISVRLGLFALHCGRILSSSLAHGEAYEGEWLWCVCVDGGFGGLTLTLSTCIHLWINMQAVHVYILFIYYVCESECMRLSYAQPTNNANCRELFNYHSAPTESVIEALVSR